MYLLGYGLNEHLVVPLRVAPMELVGWVVVITINMPLLTEFRTQYPDFSSLA